jgi:flagellar assembly factor FliW
LFDPSKFESIFKPEITDEDSKLLGEGDYVCWTILSLKEDFNASTVNLKSPIIINSSTGVAAQVILEQDYPVRQPILEGDN